MNKVLFLAVLIFSMLNVCDAQQVKSTEVAFSKVYTKQAYLADIDELAKTLTENHPQPYEFISKDAFWRNVEEKKKLITNSTTYGEFIWHSSSIIASIGCGHTGLGYFNQEDNILPVGLRFPVEARLIDSRLYVSDPLVNGKDLSAGDEIFSINGKDVSEIKAAIYKHISSDGYNESFPKEILNGYFTAMIAYHFNFPTSYEIVIKNKKTPVRLKQLKEYKNKPRVNPKDKCQDRLCFEIMDYGIAKLTVRSFGYYGEEFEVFKTFVDRSLKEINSKKIENLVIDVRLNGGGSSESGSYLLEHIANENFQYFAKESTGSFESKQEVKPSENRFRGNTYILTDGNGTSTTGHFLSLAKANGFATLIGEEAGATYTVNDNSGRFKLTNTGMSYRVARNTFFTTAKNLPKDRGVLPDHHISQNITDFLSGTDTALEYTIDLILKDKVTAEKEDSLQYIDSNKPSLTPKVFAPDFISKKDEAEFGSVFSKDGTEFYYAVDAKGKAEIRYTKLKKGKWLKPKTILSHKKYSFNDPFLSPDEDRLYYISDMPLNKKDKTTDYDIWFSKRKAKKWSTPINAGTEINTTRNEFYISFTSNGTMYFASNKGKAIKRTHDLDIYSSEFIDGKFQTPVKLSDSINTRGYEADVFISPDESYIIFTAARRSGFGRADLYISFKDTAGNWTKSKNMGEVINSKNQELCPFVTADGKYFFYTSNQDIYWVSTEIFESLK